MIGKIMRNLSFQATTGYVLGKEKAQIIGGNMVGRTTDELVAEFAMSKSFNPDIERPVYHAALSFSHADKATNLLTPSVKAQIALRHFAGMVVSSREKELLKGDDRSKFNQRVDTFLKHEIQNYQVCVAEHHDTEHQHLHLIASRINLLNGRCIDAWYERMRNKKICRDLERQFSLEQVSNNWGNVVRPDAVERERILKAAPIMAKVLESQGAIRANNYSLIRQGKTIIYRRKDNSIALKARQDAKGLWIATAGNLSQAECNIWLELPQKAKKKLEATAAAKSTASAQSASKSKQSKKGDWER